MDRACQTRTGHVQLGQGCVILEDVKLSQTGQVKLNRSSKKNIGMKFFEHKIFFDPKYLDPIFLHIFFWIQNNLQTNFFGTYFFHLLIKMHLRLEFDSGVGPTCFCSFQEMFCSAENSILCMHGFVQPIHNFNE